MSINRFICPECKGNNGEYISVYVREKKDAVRVWEPCFFCDGTGHASDEEEFVEFWRSYEN
jgi:hypothetical protein